MKCLIICSLVALFCAQSEAQGFWSSISNIFGIRESDPCERNPEPIFKEAINDFTVRLTKRAAFYSNLNNFVISPYTIWLSLASIAEFTDEYLQPQYFKALNLPQEKCLRNKMYLIASTLEIPGPDVDFKRRRALTMDRSFKPNDEWLAFNEEYKTLEYLPIDNFDEANFESIRGAMGVPPLLTYYGNSLFLDRLFYDGLWTTAFSDGGLELAPFYNDLGQPIATIEYMRMKSRVRLAHIPFIDAKVLELPVGVDGRYTMLFTMGIKSNTVKTMIELWRSSIIIEILRALTVSLVPLEVAIPKFFMHYGFNAKPSLEDLGFGQLFSDPSATKYISEPPALPSYYFQRLDVNISSGSLQQEAQNGNAVTGFFENAASNFANAVGRDFIANRPFFFSLIEKKTGVTIFTGLYAYPEEQTLPLSAWKSTNV